MRMTSFVVMVAFAVVRPGGQADKKKRKVRWMPAQYQGSLLS